MDNYNEVLHQMREFGIDLRPRDADLKVDGKRVTCGKGGKWWYWLSLFRPDSGGSYIVGRIGSYKSGESRKVEVNWKPLSEAERARMAAERQRAQELATARRREEAELAAMRAADLWRKALRVGASPYVERKGIEPEACRYLHDGTLVLPLLRYDLPREESLKGVQRILPNGKKLYTKDFAKAGCSLRLGERWPMPGAPLVVLVCEGYATGCTLRMATQRELTVYVGFDAGNLEHVVRMVRDLHPDCRLVVCADDDWKTVDQQTGKPNNPGRTAARLVAKRTERCDMVWPVFKPGRGDKDTDFNDLHVREGLQVVRAQIGAMLHAIDRHC